jgi:hypothetical protein
MGAITMTADVLRILVPLIDESTVISPHQIGHSK